MSRSRNIKPGFFENELLAECCPLARILFIGLWCEADREGRLEDRPKRIKAKCLPYDDCDPCALLSELESGGFILRYSFCESQYIQILAFAKHQNPHVKEAASSIPAPYLPDTSTVQESEIPAPARLIPDSLLLIPDSLERASTTSVVEVTLPDGNSDPPSFDAVNTRTNGHDRREPIPFQQIVNAYHESLPDAPRVEVLTKARKGYLRQRWLAELPTIDAWRNYFADVAKSRFLTGRTPGTNGKPPFIANLEWLSKPSNFAKVAEGNYHR